MAADRRQVEGKTSLITEDVESIAFCVLRGGRVVFALVEEGSGLLAFEGVEMELNPVHGESGCGFVSLQQAGSAGWEALEFADAGIDALEDRGAIQLLGQLRDDRFADRVAVDC